MSSWKLTFSEEWLGSLKGKSSVIWVGLQALSRQKELFTGLISIPPRSGVLSLFYKQEACANSGHLGAVAGQREFSLGISALAVTLTIQISDGWMWNLVSRGPKLEKWEGCIRKGIRCKSVTKSTQPKVSEFITVFCEQILITFLDSVGLHFFENSVYQIFHQHFLFARCIKITTIALFRLSIKTWGFRLKFLLSDSNFSLCGPMKHICKLIILCNKKKLNVVTAKFGLLEESVRKSNC